MIKVTVNGVVTEVEEGILVGDLLKEFGPELPEKILIGRIGKEEKVGGVNVFKTTKGRFITDIQQTLNVQDARVAWITEEMMVFGPIPYGDEFSSVRREVNRNVGDIFLLNSESEVFLGIALADHSENTTLPEGKETDVIGRITAGSSLLKKLNKDDIIKSVIREYETEKILDRISLDTMITKDTEIFSHIDVELYKSTPNSAEVFFSYLKNSNGVITVTDSAKAYIRVENQIPTGLPKENNRNFRKKGDVLVRSEGVRRNSIYIYRTEHMPQDSLNNIGRVTHGVELVEIAREDDRILVHSNPSQIFVLGITQSEAEKLLSDSGISQERRGDESDDAVIVSQEPSRTMEITDKLITEGIPQEKLIHIKFFDEEAPISTNFIRDATGLYKNYPIGKLNVVSSSESLILLEAEAKKEAIVHENIPERGDVGLLGMTNMSRQWYGLLGVRFDPSDDYGPTGEGLDSTNIVGKIVKGMEELKQMESKLYFREVT
ncbi:MAG: methanogenesis marker 3 protein [Halobacteriota archaeon]|nr:methanogenesis marker 3 protein [Halobacteriota archaeon]